MKTISDSFLIATNNAINSNSLDEVTGALEPISVLVNEMLADIIEDTKKMVQEEKTRFESEQKHMEELSEQLSEHKENLTDVVLRIEVLESQKSNAVYQNEIIRGNLTQLKSDLESSQHSCLARAPLIYSTIVAIQNDLIILKELSTKINDIQSGKVSGSEIGTFLIEFEKSMKSSSLLLSTSSLTPFMKEIDSIAPLNKNNNNIDLNLLEMSEGIDSEETDNKKYERLKNLLQKLISELEIVLTNNKNDVEQLTKKCTAKDAQLTNSVNILQSSFDQNENITQTRTKEIKLLTEKKSQVKENIQHVQQIINQVQSETKERLQISLTLIKAQQQAQLILTEMQKVIQNFKNSFSNIGLTSA
eukprot:c18150_g1_i1.p1 GENE.c18150_g1_i1~~c18150_g1_i1.p1  ORF type:complete len:403 (+),score=150.82 c18150_g1_i1:129-1211(+)